MLDLDMVGRIADNGPEAEKLARVAHLVCETAKRLANLDHAPVRDSRGPRAGKGHSRETCEVKRRQHRY